MKTLVLLVSAVALVIVGTNVAWCDHPGLENGSRGGVEEDAAQRDVSYDSFKKEWQESFKKVKSAVQTYVTTVVTVVKALINAIHTVMVSLAKLVFRFVFAVALIVTRWLLGWLLPI